MKFTNDYTYLGWPYFITPPPMKCDPMATTPSVCVNVAG